ncbi:uncharacterized protein [Heterodontus francisci]|uniref:uncharacterized protein n=1 Tax=Heterodontus francisci TaxID=7792 RepID=UPI00355C1FFE
MAPAVNLRQVLVEIPNPQPKIAVHLRRSYEDILNSTRTPSQLTTLHVNIPTSFRRTDNISSDDCFVQNLNVTPENISEVSSFVRRKFGNGRRLCFSSPAASNYQTKTLQNGNEKELPFKKQRLNFKPGSNLEFKLNDLASSQLVRTLLLHRYPELDDEDLKLVLPSLNLKFAQEQLELSKINMYRSIPRWRLGSNRDAYCYRKAHVHLQAFKKICLEQGRLLLQSECWETALDYVLIAWRYTSELPQWDNSFHNECTQQCFAALAVQCITSLQRSCLELEKYKQLKKRLRIAYTQSKLIKPCLEELDKIIEVLKCSPPEQNLSC